MKIGILTFHRAHNYGAVLQCYALQQYLIQEGHDVYVIDYNNKQLWEGYNWRDRERERVILKSGIKLPIRLYRYLDCRKRQIVRYYKFKYFQEHVIRLAELKTITESPYDLILIGSDQVWNPSITHGFDSYYWGLFERPSTTKVATYAASLRAFWEEDQYEYIYNALKKLDGISAREASVGRYVNGLFPDLNVLCVPDPVMLLSPMRWKKLAKTPTINVPYVFFYQAETSETVYQVALEIALHHGLPLFVLSADQWAVNSKECHSASPQEFLGWILNAKLVVTSSFHALVFCILFQKDFYAVNMNRGQDERLKNVISMFGLDDRLIDNSTQCKTLKPFSVNEQLRLMTEKAHEYISLITKKLF